MGSKTNIVVIAIFFLMMSSISADDLLFAVAYSKEGIYYPKPEVLDWAKGKALHLTSGGIRQQYILGRELRKRYMDDLKLLEDKYTHKDQILIRSAASKQAISSAYAQLSGLYLAGSGELLQSTAQQNIAIPPNTADYSAWKKELESAALNFTIQAVPIVENGGMPDYVLNASEACEGIKNMVSYAIGDKWEQNSAFKTFYERLEKAFNLPVESVKNVIYAGELRDALICSLADGAPIGGEEEALKLISETLDISQNRTYDFLVDLKYEDRNVSRIISTHFLNQIKAMLETSQNNHLKGYPNKLKFASFIGGEGVLESVLQNLDLNQDKKHARSASLLLIELYKDSNSNEKSLNDYYVKVLYNKEVDVKLNYTLFIEGIKQVVYSSEKFDSFCASYKKSEETSNVNWVLIGIIAGSIIGVLLIGGLIFYLVLKCKSSSSTDEAEEEAVLAQLKGQLGVKE